MGVVERKKPMEKIIIIKTNLRKKEETAVGGFFSMEEKKTINVKRKGPTCLHSFFAGQLKVELFKVSCAKTGDFKAEVLYFCLNYGSFGNRRQIYHRKKESGNSCVFKNNSQKDFTGNVANTQKNITFQKKNKPSFFVVIIGVRLNTRFESRERLSSRITESTILYIYIYIIYIIIYNYIRMYIISSVCTAIHHYWYHYTLNIYYFFK